jgi:hypothetical protein
MKKYVDQEQDEDYRYPFHGSKLLNPVGMNAEPVRLAKRTLYDYEPVEKLNDPTMAPPPSKTQYENYLRG